MAEQDGQEKTEQPTGKKLGDARDKGQVAKSMEINSFSIFFFGLLILFFVRNIIGEQMSEFATYIFSNLNDFDLQFSLVRIYAIKGMLFFFLLLSPFFIGLVVVALLSGIAQVGFKITPKALEPKFSKMNPAKGMKEKFFSSRSLVELIKSLLKLVIISLFVYNVISGLVLDSQGLLALSVGEIVSFMIDSSLDLLIQIALAYAIIAAADFIFQKYKFKKDMMMTKQETKEEYKQTEGSPEIKSRIKKEQMAASRKRMMEDVPKADVVITNPTHYAIALKYKVGSDSAPKVLAKGVDQLAQRIKKVASEHDVPLYEDRALARALYKVCEVGDHIPENLFHAVAQILAYVYKLKRMNKKRSIV